jgi:hypothetical protein
MHMPAGTEEKHADGIRRPIFRHLFILPLLFGLVLALCLATVSLAQRPDALKFVYVHGTNQNTPESHHLFQQRVANLHPHIMAALEHDALAKAHLLDGGKMTIDPITLDFFWGDQSQVSIEAVRRNVFIPQLNRGFLKLGERARKKLAFTLHDAIWVEQQTNKKAIISALFDQVAKTGDQPIMLMGHSAGSLVTFNFLMYRLPYIEIQDFGRELRADPSVLSQLEASGMKYTCLEALLSSSGIRYDAHGKLVPFFSGIEPQLPPELISLYRRQWLENMPRFTRQYCLPENKVRGMVTFGSPLALFYSLAVNPEKDESYLTMSMANYMLGHHMVWLHVNHWDDFIALPLADRERVLMLITQRLGKSPALNGGFVENYIYEGGGATFVHAHSWYWTRPDAFAKSVAKAYHEGYEDWYSSAKK